MQYVKFVINERPVCVWDMDMKKLNSEYLQSINTEYFSFIAEQCLELINGSENEKTHKLYASITLRHHYSMALETMFALIGAMLQSPQCVVGWMIKYRNSELEDIIKKINSDMQIMTLFKKFDSMNWENVSRIIFGYFPNENLEMKNDIVLGFKKSLQSLASDFLNEKFKSEYNSIKHGYRIKAGGFKFALKPKNNPTQESHNNWITFMESDYGTSFYQEEKLKQSLNNIRIKKLSKIWQPIYFYEGIQLINLLIKNIKSFLFAINKLDMNNVVYSSLDNDQYASHLKHLYRTGETSLDFGFDYDEVKIQSASQIKAVYNK